MFIPSGMTQAEGVAEVLLTPRGQGGAVLPARCPSGDTVRTVLSHACAVSSQGGDPFPT